MQALACENSPLGTNWPTCWLPLLQVRHSVDWRMVERCNLCSDIPFPLSTRALQDTADSTGQHT